MSFACRSSRCAHSIALALAAGWLLLIAACPGTNAEPSDYLIDVKDTENSDLPNSSVTAIAQTPDGYLWIGTYNGLARFDGVRFVTYTPVNTPALNHARIQNLFVDDSGALWINTYRGGLTSCRNGVFLSEWEGSGEFDIHTTLASPSAKNPTFVTQYGQVLANRRIGTNGLPTWTLLSPPSGRARLVFQCADENGVLWFLTREGQIMRLDGGEFKDLAAGAAPVCSRVLTIARGPKGRLWAGTDLGVARWDGARFENMTPTNGAASLEVNMIFPAGDDSAWILSDGRLHRQEGRRWVAEAAEWQGLLGWASGHSTGAHLDREGGLWLNHYGNGLFHITPDGRFERFTAQDGLHSDRVWAWFQGREGDVWVGLDRGGLAHLRERRFQVIPPAEGQPTLAALSVCQDDRGTLWFGTYGGGLGRWNDGESENFSVGNNSSTNFVFSVCAARGRDLWLSASAGEDLFVFRNGRFQRPPIEMHGVKAILSDHTGRVWFGNKTGLGWWSPEGRRLFGSADGMTASAIRAVAEAGDGTIWCGGDDGRLYRCVSNRLDFFQAPDAPANQQIWALLADSNGILWAGTSSCGLLRFRDGQFSRLTTEKGLPSDVVSEILEDRHGQLWLGTHKGICRVAKSGLNACLDGKTRRVDCVTYGRLDGLPTMECASGYQPACWEGNDGRLWFATVRGVVSVKPEGLKGNPYAPPVVIEEMRVDGEPVERHASRIIVQPGRKQIEFQYTALSLVMPDSIRFRYRLKGLARDWIEVGNQRSAHYGTLPAGDFEFRVLACNNDGVWNDEGAALSFTVLPYFYQTSWFVGLTAFTLAAVLVASVRAVISRKYRLALARLEQQHAIERDRARIANDIHDDLGAGLTQITLLSELAQREPPDHAAAHLERISAEARKMTRAMDEIVWAVDPQHDSLNGLMDYVSAYTEDFLRTAGIRCRMDLPAELPPLHVDAELRYNLFLALKEALNNVVKHARATEVWLRLRIEPYGFTLAVEDNGQGAAPVAPTDTSSRIRSGHGLPNLEKRLAAVGGRCKVTSAPGQGMKVEMTIRARPAASPVVAIAEPVHDRR